MAAEGARDELWLRLLALHLGASDMWDVWQSGRYLLGEDEEALGHADGLPEKVRRTLETGMIVSYARPFVDTRRGLPQMKRARGLSDELRATHKEILVRRHTVYAHTDNTAHRRILELGDPTVLAEWLRDPAATFTEEWHSPTDAGLRDLMALSKAHLDAFVDEIGRVRLRVLNCEGVASQGDAGESLARATHHEAQAHGELPIDGAIDGRPRIHGELVEPDEIAIPLLVAIGRFVFAAGGLEQALQLEAIRLFYTQIAAGAAEPNAVLQAELDVLRRLTAGGLLTRLREFGLATELHDRVADAIRRRNDLVHRTFDDPKLMAAAIDGALLDDVVERVDRLAIDCGELTVELVAYAITQMEELFGMSREQLLSLVLAVEPGTIEDPREANLVALLRSLDDPGMLLTGLGELVPRREGGGESAVPRQVGEEISDGS